MCVGLVLCDCCASRSAWPRAQTPGLHPSHGRGVIYNHPVPARLNSFMPSDGILLKRLLLVDDAAVEVGLDA